MAVQLTYHPIRPITLNRLAFVALLAPIAILVVVNLGAFMPKLQAQERPAAGSGTADEPVPKSAQEELASQQRVLASRFSTLEELFLRMSELESSTNPSRSALLLQAAKQSKEQATVQRMGAAIELLTKRQFTRAIEEQQASRESLKKLLELLQSENRQDRVREERKKYEQWIKDIKRLERIERSLRARTENGQDNDEAAKDQADVEKQAAEIAEQMGELLEQLSAGKPKPSDSKPSDSKPSDSKPSDSKPSDSKPSDSKPSDSKPSDSKPSDSKPSDSKPSDSKPSDSKPSDSKPSDSKPSDSKPSDSKPSDSKPSDSKPSDSKPSDSKPSDSKPSDSKPSDSKPSDSKPSDSSSEDSQESSSDSEPDKKPSSPEENAKQRIDKARQRMQKAIEKLREKNKSEAVEEQQAAEKELKDAVVELERILRQKREEEVERSLAALEGRFRRMLDMQIAILDKSKKLDLLEGENRERQVEIQASKLSLDQRKILVEGQRAMLLLQEEGSSSAFPEALQQTLGDMELVVERLQKSDISKWTISIEEEIVASLEEMIESLKQEQKKREEKKKDREKPDGQGGGGGQDQTQPLVDALSELRLVKTLQLRINKRTDRLSSSLNDPADAVGQSRDAELRDQLRELARRQEKIQEVTREIVTKAKSN